MEFDRDKFDNEVCEEMKFERDILSYAEVIHDNIEKRQKYMKMKHKVKEELRVLKSRRARVYKERYHHYKFEKDYTLTVTEIKDYVGGDDIYRKSNRNYNLKELELESVEEALACFKDRGWSLKDLISLYREEGII